MDKKQPYYTPEFNVFQFEQESSVITTSGDPDVWEEDIFD